MSLRLPDRWLWDFWVVRDGPDYHVFYLQAPRSLVDPELRHWHASIGHAVSTDLRRWEVLPDALAPGEPGAWDDYTVWTGSIEPEMRPADDGTTGDRRGWRLLYTGTAHATRGLVQRIGLATSDDLLRWTRHPVNPVLEPDHRIYEEMDPEAWYEEAWRDPWLMREPGLGQYHALMTARLAHGPIATRGVIGLASAERADRWVVREPITRPGVYGHMEIPQLHRIPDGRWCLLFSVPGLPEGVVAGSGRVPLRAGLRGTHYLLADAPLGLFEWESHGVLLADEAGTWYGAKLLDGPDGRLTCLAWIAHDADGGFVGELSDPMEVVTGPDGPHVVQG